MKYKSLTEYFHNNPNQVLYDCLDYYGKFKDEILDSDYGKNNDELYKKVNALRNALYEIIQEFKDHIHLLFHTLSYYHYEVNRSIEPMSRKEYTDTTYNFICHIEDKLRYISDRSGKVSSLLADEFEDLYENDDWIKDVIQLLDDYDKKYNLDKFKYPYIAKHTTTIAEYFAIKYTFKDLDELHSEFNKEWFKDLLKYESIESKE